MENPYILFLTALIPMALGFAWYSPALFGKAWMKSLGFTEEDLQGGNMALIFGLSYLFSLFLSAGLYGFTVHQSSVFSLLMTNPGFDNVPTPEAEALLATIKEGGYWTKFRTFGHGVVHGIFAGVLVALPVLATNSMFERRSWKNIWINVGYWITCFALMAGVLSAYA